MAGVTCEALAGNYLAFIQVASIRLWLCVNESTAEEPDYCWRSLLRARDERPCSRAAEERDELASS